MTKPVPASGIVILDGEDRGRRWEFRVSRTVKHGLTVTVARSDGLGSKSSGGLPVPGRVSFFANYARLRYSKEEPPLVFIYGVVDRAIEKMLIKLDDASNFDITPIGRELDLEVNFFCIPLAAAVEGEVSTLSSSGELVERRRLIDPLGQGRLATRSLRSLGGGEIAGQRWELLATWSDQDISLAVQLGGGGQSRVEGPIAADDVTASIRLFGRISHGYQHLVDQANRRVQRVEVELSDGEVRLAELFRPDSLSQVGTCACGPV